MHNRADYEKALVIVGSVERAWDPYCLLEGGAPTDAAQAISTVF